MTRALPALLLLACIDGKTDPVEPWVLTSSSIGWQLEDTSLHPNAVDALYWQGRLWRMADGGPGSVDIHVELRTEDGQTVGGGVATWGSGLELVGESEWAVVPTTTGVNAEVCAWVMAADSNVPVWTDLDACWGM